jgi:uncharacterized protein (DUF1330 family)
MNQRIALGLAMLAGAAIGATAVNGLHAQNKVPGAYAIIDISQITDRDSFTKELLPKAQPAILDAGGKFITRTEKLSTLDGTPPQRYVIIAFDSVDKAKSWYASAAWKEVDAMRTKFTNSRLFVAQTEGPTP